MLADCRGAVPSIGHRSALVEQDRTAKIRLLFVLSNVDAIRLAEYVPVDVTSLISTHVLAVLLELDTEPFVWRSVQTGAESFDHSASQHLQVTELAQVVGSQIVVYVGDGDISSRERRESSRN